MNRRGKLGLSVVLLFSLLVLLAIGTRTFPPKPGAVVATGSPWVARFSHTATLLPNNKVLIAGGMERNGVWLDSAEIYDPVTERFTAAGRMSVARAGATATLLPNGKVLVAGGNDGSGASLATTEIFDPATNIFTLGPAMITPRGHANALLLKNGKVLILGGNRAGDHQPLASAEIYDPATGRFTPTGSMATAHTLGVAVRLEDGRVLVAGGVSRGSFPDQVVGAAAEIYDPVTGRFTPTGSLNTARHKVGAALLRNGKVLVAGGSDTYGWGEIFSSTEIYDPSTGRFSPGPEMKSRRFKLPDGVVELKDGRVLIAGGAERPEIYDVAAPVLATAAGSPLDGFFFSSATALADGRVLLFGGYGANPSAGAVKRAWIWEP
ncbi:MAG TPA: kelch repeat-containing protein [Candidatus Angelobacter sp.]